MIIKKIIAPIIIMLLSTSFYAQKTITELRSDGPGNTYELINSKFATENSSIIEAPGIKRGDCDNHSSYVNHEGTSDHITEIIDPEKGNIFQFEMHAKEDIDRTKCNKIDRQRNEIKIYDHSPEYTQGNKGETMIYQWCMKIPKDLQLSSRFTHFHQIKAKGGDVEEEKSPLITITGYKKSKGDEMHIRHSSSTQQTTIAKVNFNLFRGQWVEFTETVTYKKGKGKYQLLIKNQKTNSVILDLKENKIVTYRKDALFMRPKWGFYRSILDSKPLKDEKVFYEYFKITELK